MEQHLEELYDEAIYKSEELGFLSGKVISANKSSDSRYETKITYREKNQLLEEAVGTYLEAVEHSNILLEYLNSKPSLEFESLEEAEEYLEQEYNKDKGIHKLNQILDEFEKAISESSGRVEVGMPKMGSGAV